jgi:UDP-glucose 4-epimerase
MSRILLTGAAGFIAGHLFEALCEDGHEVWCLDNDWKGYPFPFRALSPQSSRDWKVDVRDVSDMIECFFSKTKFDAVIHLAAQPSLQASWKNAPFDAQTNILGTINLLGLCQRYNVKKFIFASTSAVYAPRVDGSYSENCLIGPQNPYGVSKAAAEYYIRISGVPYTILRLGNVYGPRQVPLGENQLIPRALAHIYQGAPFEIYGDGKQIRSFVYVEDVARAFVDALGYPFSGTFNISEGVSHQVNSVLKYIYYLTHFAGIDELLANAEPAWKSFWEYGKSKPGELHCVILDSTLAKVHLEWSARTSLRAGLTKTVRAWPK